MQWQSWTEVAGPTVIWFRSGHGTHTETSPGTSPSEYVPFGQTGNKMILRYSLKQQICVLIYGSSKHCRSNNFGTDWLPLRTHIKLICRLATIFQSCTTVQHRKPRNLLLRMDMYHFCPFLSYTFLPCEYLNHTSELICWLTTHDTNETAFPSIISFIK